MAPPGPPWAPAGAPAGQGIPIIPKNSVLHPDRQFGQPIRLLIVEPEYPSLEVLSTDGACESTLQGAYVPIRCVQKNSVFQAELGQVLLV